MHLRLQRNLAKILTLQLALNWPASLFLHSPVFRLLLDFGSPMPWRPVCPSILGSSGTLGGGANPSRKWRDPHSHVLLLLLFCFWFEVIQSISAGSVWRWSVGQLVTWHLQSGSRETNSGAQVAFSPQQLFRVHGPGSSLRTVLPTFNMGLSSV